MIKTKEFFIKEIDGIYGVWTDINNGSMVYEITTFSTEKAASDYLFKLQNKK